jgi:DNA-binding GntR family transcriptional regulator
MKLACQEQLLPGDSLEAKFDFARRAGFAGIELRARGDGRFAARLPELRAAARAGDRERFAALDFEFHADLTRLSGNSRLHRVFVQQAGVLRTLLRLEITTQYESLAGILAEHEHLLEEILSGDPARAEAACELHLAQARDRVIKMRGGA